MNIRHTAALALVGWSLMVPGLSYQSATNVWTAGVYDKHGKPVYSAWTTYGSYDTAAECQSELGKLNPYQSPVMAIDEGAIRNPLGLEQATRESVKQATCIANTDPRLKRK
jgi:hypothetical protein